MPTQKKLRRSILSAAVETLEERKHFTAAPWYFKEISAGWIGVWQNTTGTGTPYANISTGATVYTVAGTSAGISVVIDESAGQAMPNGGLALNGSSSAVSSNAFLLEGASGAETANFSSSAMSFGSTSASYLNMGAAIYNPNGGTTTMNISSGVLALQAPKVQSPQVITQRQFASLFIAYGSELLVQSTTLANHASRQVLVFPHAALVDSGALDLTDNDIVETNGVWSGWNNYVMSGNIGTSIKTVQSSATAATTAIGVVPNNQGSGTGSLYSTFDGVAVTSTAIFLKWTYAGDANDDGLVDGSDYALIDNNNDGGGNLTGWFNGDFNYDGVENTADYDLINASYTDQGSTQL